METLTIAQVQLLFEKEMKRKALKRESDRRWRELNKELLVERRKKYNHTYYEKKQKARAEV